MRFSTALFGLLSALSVALASPVGFEKRATVEGFDISHYQSSVDFAGAYNAGLRFVLIKATEGTTYKDPAFSSHYNGATTAGFIRGGYHFARPSSSSGAVQASFFAKNGGGWSNDGRTLPGMLDLEGDCAGKSASAMVSWIQDFVETYLSETGRHCIIYTNRSWWQSCTGDSTAFSNTSPLHLASWNNSPGTIPGGWGYQTIWQYNDHSSWGGDSDRFNGDATQLRKLAMG
ncbi:putative N,O-diacetyl muramidase [Pseudovirgaria hyperparasitica]|uniref:N,O-diacetylmuramidase n=1 Tax=Pseudovirgaria hyperparasitica TaxID=470096 RepID=A0A6A6WE28_9PEZI|nr:putative N,O-diacetyl muramidase [Pseudovirgaria hyperparasitica]KAF2760314.1 putative N,O-diacetyl muramidase [Pseudovirgaria hyperparasitica]